jgi:diguanylate cyclase (GGDEF)-like protein
MASGSGDRPLARQLEELAAVHESLRALTSTLEFPEILRAVLDRIKAFTAAEGLSLLLYDPERDELVFAATETLAENALVGRAEPGADRAARQAASTGGAMLAEDGRILAVPLRRAGKTVGAVEVRARHEAVPFTCADAGRVQDAADAAFVGVEPEGLSHDAGALGDFFGRLAAAVPNEAASLVLLDDAGRERAFTASRALRPGVIDGLRLSCNRGIAGWVGRHREPVRLADASADPRHYSVIADRTGLVPRSMLCVPVVKKDRLLGVIQVINKLDGSPFTEDELRLVQTLADHAAIAIENASLYREARIAAITDDLTGLANTRHFNRMLPELMARARPLTLLVLDLDNFKALVDREGHLVGSRTIGHVGRLIAARLRPADLAARFGGDEFVVIMPATPTAAAREVAEAIREAIAGARVLAPDGVDIAAVTASVGLATYPDHAHDAESLFRAADAAMYAVKRGGKNAVGVAS